MKKLNNYDFKMASGLALRTEVKIVINEVVDRLNESHSKLLEMDVIPAEGNEITRYKQSYFTLDCIFSFLASCGIFSANTYEEYQLELAKMKLNGIIF